MSNVHENLFLHMVKRGLDRAYRAADVVSREFPSVGLDVHMILDDEVMDAAEWGTIGLAGHFIFDAIDADGEYDCVRVPLAATEHAMEEAARKMAKELASVKAQEHNPRKYLDRFLAKHGGA